MIINGLLFIGVVLGGLISAATFVLNYANIQLMTIRKIGKP